MPIILSYRGLALYTMHVVLAKRFIVILNLLIS